MIKRPLTLEIEEAIWEEFKVTVPRGETLNEAVVCLIERKIKEFNKEEDKRIKVENGGCLNERTD